MLKLYYDLHIHSCLSPCGDDDMLPSNIVGMAALKGLDVIALTDHNSCKNCPAVMELAKEYGITAIPGMELTTSEEVHVVCLFPSLEKAMSFDSFVHEKLTPIKNDEKIFGKQQICDKDDIITGTEEFLLINATEINFDEVFDVVSEFGGIMIPAHIDKSANSLISNLGFIPPDSRFACAEVKHTGFLDKLTKQHGYLKNCKIISDSDAHYLENINEPVHYIYSETKEIPDILNALKQKSDSDEF